MAKRISVVLAACNGAPYLPGQINSILPQLGENDELVVSLDPSMDGSEVIISKIKDSRIRVVQGPGKGVIHNVENGLRCAEGEYIFLSDQDDIWFPEKLQTVMEEFKDSRIVLVIHDCKIVNDKLEIIEPSYFIWHKSKEGFWNNVVRNSYIGCCMAFHRRLLQNALPFPNDIPMHDQWLGLVANKTGQTVFLHKPLIAYRRHGSNLSSLSHSNIRKMVKWRLTLIKNLKERGIL
ncbi:glycosyltransferase [Faecalibaculum rodentium]|uniref:glycosyltransferase n=1 Tax=Faecalibaculum rodentium TaxID=1702221 RepID=UPI0023F24B9A|nr:glycosyltransferase [Faecalibaculum rodentium]